MLTILNPNVLVDQLRSGRVPTVPIVILMALNISFQNLAGHPGFLGALASPAALPFVLLQLGMSLASLLIAFRSNGGEKGHDFFTRFFSLTAVLYFWVYIAGYFAYVLLSWFVVGALGQPGRDLYRSFGPAQLVFGAVTSLVYLLSLQYFFSKVASKAAP
ncbi:hypothetical protein [Mesoterricola silvestris]|uniref:hypothetical protein n=1 Tax=Mesoterricola silvestris TaxID=2927979 RepID=UPI00292DF560|nr:hypothetical protein [Mesoterricola silvestris]